MAIASTHTFSPVALITYNEREAAAMNTLTRASLYAISALTMSAQTLTTLHSFAGPDGANPMGPLILASDGNLYATTKNGGSQDFGAIFRISTAGVFETLRSFCSGPGCADGKYPISGLMQAADGNFYGTTSAGGAGQGGTIFKTTAAGDLTVIHSFCFAQCTDGVTPEAGLVQAPDGSFYGTTFWGPGPGWGTLFHLDTSGEVSVLYSFCPDNGRCENGSNPESLILSANGDLYGTTFIGGPGGGTGTFFSITAAGKLSTIASFCRPECYGNPHGPVMQASDGDFYGVAGESVYRISSAGAFTILHRFCAQTGCLDGSSPYGGLIQDASGNFYGTTESGGAHNGGTVYELTPGGQLTTLCSFCSEPACADGERPFSKLLQTPGGDLYGVTNRGGANGLGTVFRLSLPK